MAEGGGGGGVIVRTAELGVPSVAHPVGEKRTRLTVTSLSSEGSSIIVTMKVWTVTPRPKFSVLETGV